MILALENLQDSKRPLDQSMFLAKLPEIKYIQKSVAFIYIKSERAVKEIR
jgi:hypothetical protein